jgi:hypothetical protein
MPSLFQSLKEFFAECVVSLGAEIDALEKEGGEKSYELFSGEREHTSTGSLYVFILTDSTRLPEDASGSLRAEGREFRAMVVSQEGNRLWLLVEGLDEFPAYLPSAKLVINETELLRRLKEKIEELAASQDFGLAAKALGIEPAIAGWQSPPQLDDRIAGQAQAALAQAIGSEVTYLWGPPGTGKTFTIAALVASLVELGETVLVTSHTHAAVEQALWALVEPPAGHRAGGYFHGRGLLDDGRVLKVGVPKAPKIPRNVCLEAFLEDKARERQANITTLEQECQRVVQRITQLEEKLQPWKELFQAELLYQTAAQEYSAAQEAARETSSHRHRTQEELAHARAELDRASRSFFVGRKARIQRATSGVEAAQSATRTASERAATADAHALRRKELLADAHARLLRAREATHGLPPELELASDLESLASRQNELEDEIAALAQAADNDARALVANALALFTTLTKLYTDRVLIHDLKWDTVVLDEASMAMPPLVAYAAARAKKRIVAVGDMYQLPPVVRGDSENQASLLSKDVFELSGVTDAIEGGASPKQLAKLMVQRRMHPDIASVARHIVKPYRELEDDESTRTQRAPSFTSALGSSSSLITVDLSDLNPWSGKVPGSLSRFNFISGQVAVELASLYAAELAGVSRAEAARIGIVTPYAAQLRFLDRLIQSLSLQDWVMAGTVHRFQGNECDVIVFDSVVGEPHWTARFTNPGQFGAVKRDLNVAVTRARHQFVFVGDARWLNKNAKRGSGYGDLWAYLSEHGDHLKATDLVGAGFRARVAKSVEEIKGWDISKARRADLLTEKEFYPAFVSDLAHAEGRVILYTPFIGKTRWPDIEPHIAALPERGVEVFMLHKPLTDPEWRKGDSEFGRSVFAALRQAGVRLVPMSGVHAKTIVIDSHIVYEGSLNWASQVASYEHMLRIDNKDLALVIERMLQLEPITNAYAGADYESACPKCGGPLMVVNQRERQNRGSGPDQKPLKLGCLNHEEDRARCPDGYLRPVDRRAPFPRPPVCERGSVMRIRYTKSGKPWEWECAHKTCRRIKCVTGDPLT